MNDEILERADATVRDVDFKQRLITVLAVPWEQEGDVMWRGEWWKEVVSRSAFNGLEDHAGRIPVNRQHVVGDTVGKVVQADTKDPQGLILVTRIAKTPRGEETLNLAAEDMIGASVGYKIKKPSDIEIHRQRMTRRVLRGFLDHLSFVESPTWDSARVLAVRAEPSGLSVAENPLPLTPKLDEIVNDDVLKWARSRTTSR